MNRTRLQLACYQRRSPRAGYLRRSASTAILRKETNLIALRLLRWPNDRAALLALDTSFTTDRLFRLEPTDRGFRLHEVATELPIHKSYSLDDGVDVIPN